MRTSTAVVEAVSRELSLKVERVGVVAGMLDEGATIPFLARYRKERTGEMDEVELRRVEEALERAVETEKRRAGIIGSLRERELLTAELEASIRGASSLTELEDLYLPYRPKRVTRASRARERGLEPLADELLTDGDTDPVDAARRFVDPERGVADADEALAGARDIVAERVAEDAGVRGRLRELFSAAALLESSRSRRKKGDQNAEVYRDYFSWSERAAAAPSHRVLAILRGERSGYLVVHATPPEQDALAIVRRAWARGSGARVVQVDLAAVDAYHRLLVPALETELKHALFERASDAAALVFSANLRDLLLAAPLGRKRVLAVDPGFRTGCKVVCLDAQGALQHYETIYPLEPQRKTSEAAERVRELVREYRVEVIAVGNGTGGREAAAFLRGLEPSVGPVIAVNEAGASVYSASDAAREEFPDEDVTVRGAVSIGRRLMDPLAELVKIDPRSIGVGQYQHDIDSRLLEQRLAATVESCVNLVGADLNTASPHLLRHISGISERLAGSIVSHRMAHGVYERRAQLLDVPGLGAKAFEQAAGFLRIPGGNEPLDATAVHPERYPLVRRMAADAGCAVDELVGDATRVSDIDLRAYEGDEIGMPTLRDIAEELVRPGRDPRPAFELVAFSDEIRTIDDLAVGMRVPGIVTNVTDFGAFVDIGVHRDGLVHISRLAKRFVRDPREIVRAGQVVEATVVEVDLDRKRIALSMVEE